ncbi:hypothetical protein HOY80DRAFT_968732 [Tuber brumale]|nr:hypothetical protein HOY80DRAFT_968732 [Tuber brumale]
MIVYPLHPLRVSKPGGLLACFLSCVFKVSGRDCHIYTGALPVVFVAGCSARVRRCALFPCGVSSLWSSWGLVIIGDVFFSSSRRGGDVLPCIGSLWCGGGTVLLVGRWSIRLSMDWILLACWLAEPRTAK